MSIKEKFLLAWFLVVLALGLAFRHFWISTVYALGKAVALSLVSLPSFVKLAAGICSVHFLP